ncbi:LolA family protein [Thermodesulfovibrio hydrogeniphilus]
MMNRFRFKKIILTCLINVFLVSLFTVQYLSFNAYASEELVLRLEEAYKNINDANGKFIQTAYIKDLDKTQKFTGRFYIKGDKIRWQYQGEFSQVVYLNKTSLIVYDKARKQAIQSSFTEEKYGQLPLALLSRMAVLKRDFEITQRSENSLILIPKSKMGNIKSIEIITHDESFPIKSLKVTDFQDNTIKIDFQSVKINTNLKDSIFKFIPKEDDTVLKY